MDKLAYEIRQLITKKKLWQKDEKVLVAVSTGVDSMVLLQLLENIQPKGKLGVVHVNHGLREVSDEEACFLKEYCAKHELPFYMTKWQAPTAIGMEEAARKFRYTYFEEVMSTAHYQVLVTAHHQDDQIETMLMKMVREGTLESASGILLTQPFHDLGRLVRPLLYTSKDRLLAYSQEQRIRYYDDATNQCLDMQRNRLRHQVVPQLKAENARTGEHFQQLSEELFFSQTLIAQQQETWLDKYVKMSSDTMQVDLLGYLCLSEAERYFFVRGLAQLMIQKQQVTLSQKQQKKLRQLLSEKSGNWTIDLEKNWQVEKSYDQLIFKKKELDSKAIFDLKLDQSLYLSDHEWLGLFPVDQVRIPEKVKLWSEYRQTLSLNFPLEVLVRRREMGDQICLDKDLTKKVSRYFIDKKIPRQKRDQAWLLVDKNQQILAIVPYVFSYLSIAKETDRIHYVLLYKYRE